MRQRFGSGWSWLRATWYVECRHGRCRLNVSRKRSGAIARSWRMEERRSRSRSSSRMGSISTISTAPVYESSAPLSTWQGHPPGRVCVLRTRRAISALDRLHGVASREPRRVRVNLSVVESSKKSQSWISRNLHRGLVHAVRSLRLSDQS